MWWALHRALQPFHLIVFHDAALSELKHWIVLKMRKILIGLCGRMGQRQAAERTTDSPA